MNEYHAIALLLGGFVACQLITGKVPDSDDWGKFTSRRERPVLYWVAVIGQLVVLAILLVFAGSMGADPDTTRAILIATCVGVCLACSAFFMLHQGAALKHRVARRLAIAAGILFVGVVWLAGHPPEALFGAAAMAVFFNLALYQTVTFCEACGETSVEYDNLWSRAQSCVKCGEKLEK